MSCPSPLSHIGIYQVHVVLCRSRSLAMTTTAEPLFDFPETEFSMQTGVRISVPRRNLMNDVNVSFRRDGEYVGRPVRKASRRWLPYVKAVVASSLRGYVYRCHKGFR